MGQKKSSKRSATVGVSSSTVRHLVKPRTGFEQHTAKLMALYKTYAQELYVNGLDPTDVLEELTAYQTALDGESSLRAQMQLQQREALLHSSNVWTAMLAVYDRARFAARSNPNIELAIADFEQFMRVHRAAKKTTPAAPPTPVVA
jgi:hypothetical protein